MRFDLLRAAAKKRGGGAGETDPFFANVVSLLHFDGNLTDQKGRVWTAFGNAAATGLAQFGSNSLALDGSGDYLRSDNDASLIVDADFTVESWVRTADVNNTNQAICGTRWSPASGQWFLIMSNGGSGRLSLFFASFSTVTPRLITPVETALASNTYYHIAIVRAGNLLSIYIDGALAVSMVWGVIATAPIRTIGEVVNGSDVPYGNYWQGQIDDFRVTKGVARYTANFTPPTAPFPDA